MRTEQLKAGASGMANSLEEKQVLELGQTSNLGKAGISQADTWLKAIEKDTGGLFIVSGVAGSGRARSLEAIQADLGRTSSRTIENAGNPAFYPADSDGDHMEWVLGQIEAALQKNPGVLLVHTEIVDGPVLGRLLKAAEAGVTVVALLYASTVPEVCLRFSKFQSGALKVLVRKSLRGVLVQKMISMNKSWRGRVLASEIAIFTGPSNVVGFELGNATCPTLLEDAFEKLQAGLVSEEDLIHRFGREVEVLLVDQNS